MKLNIFSIFYGVLWWLRLVANNELCCSLTLVITKKLKKVNKTEYIFSLAQLEIIERTNFNFTQLCGEHRA